MPVGAYVRGKASQNYTQKARRDEQPGNYASRQRTADTARVAIPVTRLNGTLQTAVNQKESTQADHGPSSRQGQNHRHNQHELSMQAAIRDVFDTDVEALDDSTTITSLAGGENSEALPQVQYSHGSGGHRNSDSMDVEYGATTDEHQSLAERLMMELGSDPEDDCGHQPEQGQEDDGAEAEDEEEETGHDEAESYNWATNRAENGEPLSWQRIEAALREGSSEHKENLPPHSHIPLHRPSPQKQHEEIRTRSVNGEDGLDDQEPRNFQTPRAVPKFPSGGRFAPGSRFGTPNPATGRGAPSNAAALIGSRPIPRPASAPGVPVSPESANMPIHRNEADASRRNPLQAIDNEDQYKVGGIFDTTDLSVLDDSDSVDNQRTYTSLRLSTVSPVSTKRPYATFTSDYPPNILQSKSFSDLRAESFDYNPAPPQPIFPPQDPPLPLAEKLNRLKPLTDDQRQAFFSSLTMDQWEESGDWLLEQFSVLLKKAKDARHDRRQVAAVFEKEIERRYEAVEEEGKNIGKRLDEMRSGGMGVLKGLNDNRQQ